MRGAILISGHCRTYQFTHYLFQKNILFPLQKLGDVDIFISTWSEQNTTQSRDVKLNGRNIIQTDNFIEEVLDLYKPKLLKVDNFNVFKGRFLVKNICPDYKDEIPAHLGQDGIIWCIPQYFKIFDCLLLKQRHEKENNIKYDYLLRYRMDSFLEKPIEFNIIDNLLTSDTGDFVGDCLWAGTNETVSKACNVFNHLNSLLIGYDGPERLMSRYCKEQKMNNTRINQELKFIRPV